MALNKNIIIKISIINLMIDLFESYMPNYFIKNKFLIISYILSSIIYVVLESIIGPFYIGKILTNLSNPTKFIYIIFIIYGIIIFTLLVKKEKEKKIIPNILSYSKKYLYQGIIDKYSEDFRSIKMGSTVSKINLIVELFKECFLQLITEIFPHILILIGLSIFFLFLNTKIGLILILVNFIFLFSVKINLNNVKISKLKTDNHYYSIDNNLVDIYTSLLNSYLNNNQKNDKEKIKQDQDNHLSLYEKINENENKISYSIIITSVISFLFIILFLIYNKKINKNNKVIFIILLIYYQYSSLYLGKKISSWIPHYCSSLSTKSFVDNLNKKVERNNEGDIFSGNITFKKIYFYYSPNNYILKNFNLRIKDKEKIAIIGKSGSGKSSLSLLLLKLYSYQGDILVDNKNIKNIDTYHLRKNIVYCNQKTLLYDISVLDNINYSNNYSKDLIINILQKYELFDLFNNLPQGVYSNCGNLGNNLSGGMQKVVMIMRTILKIKKNNPYIIIFDEPLAALDILTRKKIIKLILDFSRNKTLIVITHGTDIIPYVNRVIDFNKLKK